MADIVRIPFTNLPIGTVTDTVTLSFVEGTEELLVLELTNSGQGDARLVVLSATAGNMLAHAIAKGGRTERCTVHRLSDGVSFFVEALNGNPIVQVTEKTGAGAVLPPQAQAEPDDLNTYLGRAIGETVPPWISTVTVSPADSVKDAIEALDIQSAAVGIARANYIVVNDVSDFPTPVGGVITLATGVVYEINGLVDIGTNRIVATGSPHIRGLCAQVDQLVCNNASALLTTTDALEVDHLTLTNSSGPVFDANATTADNFVLRSVNVVGSSSLGTIQNYGVISLRRFIVIGCSDGLTIDGTNAYLVVNSVLSTSNLGTFTFLTIPAATAFSGLSMETMAIDSAAGQTALDIDSTVTVVNRATILNSVFSGVGTPLTGITKAEIGWKFRDSVGILDSISIGELSFENNATETVITVTSQFEDINPGGGGFVLNFAERFTESSDGVLQYNGVEDIVCVVEVIIGAFPQGSGLDDWALRVAQNGGQVFRVDSTFVKAAQPTHLSLVKVINVTNGDQIRAQVANTSDTSNITVQYFAMSVRIVV